jgi:hypothetical protein
MFRSGEPEPAKSSNSLSPIFRVMVWIAGLAVVLAIVRSSGWIVLPAIPFACLIYHCSGLKGTIKLLSAQPRRGGAEAGGPGSSLESVKSRSASS